MPSHRSGRVRVLLVVLVGTVAAACSPIRLVNVFTHEAGIEIARDLRYGEAQRQRLDVYRPAAPREPGPVVVFFHGGNWKSGSRADYAFAGTALASRGFVAIVPDYRLYPEVEFPAFVEDGASVVRWVRDHAAGFGGDPARVYLMGHSAGAHIAVLLTLDERYLRGVGQTGPLIRATIGMAGPYDFLPFGDAIRPVFGPAARWPASQPVNFVDGTEPPLLLLQGGADATVDPGNTARLAARIRERGGRVRTIVYPGVGHVRILLALLPPWQAAPPVLDDAAAFIAAH